MYLKIEERNGSFYVWKSDDPNVPTETSLYSDQLCFEEMLGLVAAVTMPEQRRCLQWLKTPEQWAAWRGRLDEINEKSDMQVFEK